MQYTVQYNVLLHGYTRNTRWVLWLLTGKYDRVLVRDIHGSLHGLRPNKSLTYSRELTGSNICTDWSLYDQYIVSSDRDTNKTGLITITMPSSCSVLNQAPHLRSRRLAAKWPAGCSQFLLCTVCVCESRFSVSQSHFWYP